MKIFFLAFLASLSVLFLPLQALETSQVLEHFTHSQCLDTESGYVFFGSKPVAFWGITKKHGFLIGKPAHERCVKVRMGCRAWKNCTFNSEDNLYLFKIRELEEDYEIISLNKKRILEVVLENLSLFQYVLGAKATPESIFDALAHRDESLYDILHYDNTLVGILLGFGTTNSIMGARSDALSVVSTPTLPYAGWQEFKTQNEAWDYLTLSRLFKGYFPDNFSREQKPSMRMATLEEEIAYIDNLATKNSHSLWNDFPRLIFQGFHNDLTNDELIARYEKEQKELIQLMQSESFFENVLSRLNVTIFSESIPGQPLTVSDLANALFEDLNDRKYASLNGAIEGLEDAFSNKDARYEELDWDHFYTLWTIDELKVKDVPNVILIKELKKGSGQQLNDQISKGTFHYSVKLASDDHFPIQSERDVELDINALIPGFAKGIQGMRIGGIREIDIPPQEAYGLFTDYLSWEPLRISVELLAIQSDSPPLKIHPAPLLPERSLVLSEKEKKELLKLKDTLSYFDAKTFYTFHKDSLKAPISEHIQALKEASENHKRSYNLEALDQAAFIAYQKIKDLQDAHAQQGKLP